MESRFSTFFIFIYSNKSLKNSFINELDDLLKSVVAGYNFINQEILIIKGDFNSDIIELIKSLVIDFDEQIKVFEGFRIRDKEKLLVLKELILKKSKNAYSKISDLLDKMDESEIKEIKDLIFDGLNNDEVNSQIINSMFNNNLNITKTADDVYMHRNSITNKLDFIQKETGLDIRKFKDAALMYRLIKK